MPSPGAGSPRAPSARATGNSCAAASANTSTTSPPTSEKSTTSPPQHPDVADRLRARLTAWCDELNPPGLAIGAMAPTWNDYFDHYLEGKTVAAPPGAKAVRRRQHPRLAGAQRHARHPRWRARHHARCQRRQTRPPLHHPRRPQPARSRHRHHHPPRRPGRRHQLRLAHQGRKRLPPRQQSHPCLDRQRPAAGPRNPAPRHRPAHPPPAPARQRDRPRNPSHHPPRPKRQRTDLEFRAMTPNLHLLIFALFAFSCCQSPAAPPTPKVTSENSAEDLLLLDNGTVKIGLNRAKGASITWLSWPAHPRNIVNHADPGRLVQQSDYAGSRWIARPRAKARPGVPGRGTPSRAAGSASWACHQTGAARRRRPLRRDHSQALGHAR